MQPSSERTAVISDDRIGVELALFRYRQPQLNHPVAVSGDGCIKFEGSERCALHLLVILDVG